MESRLVQELFDGPLDIVGDVHGEMDALMVLLDRLGYRRDGSHPEGRRLVFVGDLTDRGPKSLDVVEFVQNCVKEERAQCILGNHDLNILLGMRKYDNSWFFGDEFRDDSGELVEQQLANEEDRESILRFFSSLPIALERPGLRVVHAYWSKNAIDVIRHETDVHSVYERSVTSINNAADQHGLSEIGRELAHQNDNPIKLLTSGPEQEAEEHSLRVGESAN